MYGCANECLFKQNNRLVCKVSFSACILLYSVQYSSKQYKGLQPGEYPCRPIVAKLSRACNRKFSASLALFPGPCHFSCTKERTASNEKLGGAWGRGYSFTISVAYSAPVKYKNWD